VQQQRRRGADEHESQAGQQPPNAPTRCAARRR
jgi:hypothetical protein